MHFTKKTIPTNIKDNSAWFVVNSLLPSVHHSHGKAKAKK